MTTTYRMTMMTDMADAADQHLTLLSNPATLRRLVDLDLGWDTTDLHAAATLRFKLTIAEAPRIVGLLGGASSGKSTLFNSLAGREISSISAHAHETTGPIAGAVEPEQLAGWMNQNLAFPDLTPHVLLNGATSSGRYDTLTVAPLARPAWDGRILIDTPDVTSLMSADEGSVTRRLLPWFDALIVVVDEERWFDAGVFGDLEDARRRYGAAVFVVFNRNESGPDLDTEERGRMADHARSHGAAAHCFNPFMRGIGYRPAAPATVSHIMEWIASTANDGRTTALTGDIQARTAEVIRINVERTEQSADLRQRIASELATLSEHTSLTTDLLDASERDMLGLGSRLVPLYTLFREVQRRVKRWTAGRGEVNFDKTPADLAAVLQRNCTQRFSHATDRIERIILDHAYVAAPDFACQWTEPELDAHDWAVRIRAHIDAWKEEAARQTRRGDAAAVAVGVPLLVADLLLLGGAGMSLTWAAVSVAGFFGGKGLTRAVQKSPAFLAYQTTVRAYQSLIRETLVEQTDANLVRVPTRHLDMKDPLLRALMYWSSPARNTRHA